MWEGYREWRHTFPNEMRGALRNDSAAGYKVVIVSNQSPLVEPPTEGERSLLFGRDVVGTTPEENGRTGTAVPRGNGYDQHGGVLRG